MLKSSSLEHLKNKQNLLAFSGGVDSTALFFLLLDAKINFDIAIVDYGLRAQSKEEVFYAQELCKIFHKTCHFHKAQKIEKNFEAKARKIRYDFFEKTIKKNNYQNLLTAHHLGDRFEWMLMQFCKGSGCVELAGMQELQKREQYNLIRPLLHKDKSELLEYLKTNNIKYFEDESNLDLSIKRNFFRHEYSNPMLKEYLQGIKNSFNYIDEDMKILDKKNDIHKLKELLYFQSSHKKIVDIRTIDSCLKQLSYMMTNKEKELLKTQKTLVVGRKFSITQENNLIFILAFENKKSILPKEFKEECRILKIDPKLRSYLYENKDVFLKVKELLS